MSHDGSGIRRFHGTIRVVFLLGLGIVLALSGTPSAAPSAAITRFLPTVREAAPGLPNFTVYRPADLTAVGGPVPVLLWANGACKTSNQQYWDVLSGIAEGKAVETELETGLADTEPFFVAAFFGFLPLLAYAREQHRAANGVLHSLRVAGRIRVFARIAHGRCTKPQRYQS